LVSLPKSISNPSAAIAAPLVLKVSAPSEQEASGPKHALEIWKRASHALPRKGRLLPRGNEVFWCATEGYFALLVLFKEVPTPSISSTLVINGNVKFLKVTFSFIFHFHHFT
jgi:hypothetical protein